METALVQDDPLTYLYSALPRLLWMQNNQGQTCFLRIAQNQIVKFTQALLQNFLNLICMLAMFLHMYMFELKDVFLFGI